MKLYNLYFLFFSLCINAQISTERWAPKTDLRGVFIPTISNLSWPSNKNAAPHVQKAELISILDDVKANGYNTIFFQVRAENDALYASNIAPWSYWLTGTQGKAPFPLWDPLEFVIKEARARGLDVHAWLNPYRVKQTGAMELAANNVALLNPNWTFQAKRNASDKALSLKMLNPGLPDVRNYIVNVVEDLATRYDLDGIHFDDYFYPYAGMEAKPQDANTYLENNPSRISNIKDWRRNNINLMIGMVYDALQTINKTSNKNIVFGVSPFGIWKSGTPLGIKGMSSFNDVYCDPLEWLKSGKVDYLAPQLYWQITKAQDYISLSKWWNDQVKLHNKQLYISQAFYRIDQKNPWDVTEIQNQIHQNRQPDMDATFGQIAYSYTTIKNNINGLNDALNTTHFKYKAFAPPILGLEKDTVLPLKPANIRFETAKIVWDTPSPATDGDLPIKYVVYAFDNAKDVALNKNNASKIIDITAKNELVLSLEQIKNKFFVVTSLDKNNNEGGDFTKTVVFSGKIVKKTSKLVSNTNNVVDGVQ